MTPTADTDTLANLEERIQHAIELVGRLRKERDEALADAAESKTEAERLAGEVKSLQAERKQVRGRLEKLLSQIDSINA